MSRTQLVAIFSGILLVLVLEMVRRRRLREEYSWLWLLTAIGYLLVAMWPGLADWVSRSIGAARPASAFAFLGLLFLFLIAVQFSVQISRLTEHNKDLAQQVAILDSEVRSLTQAASVLDGTDGGEAVSSPAGQEGQPERPAPLPLDGDGHGEASA
jgi:hypothetical protein